MIKRDDQSPDVQRLVDAANALIDGGYFYNDSFRIHRRHRDNLLRAAAVFEEKRPERKKDGP